jgi:GxxExxY protein
MLPNERDPLTQKIIECAIDVHKHLGPGLLESAYQAALCVGLTNSGLTLECQKIYPVMYQNVRVADFRPDLIVDHQVVVEIKSVARYDPVFLAQMLTCLRITNLQVGLIVNFNKVRLVDGIKRVGLSRNLCELGVSAAAFKSTTTNQNTAD